MDNSVGEINYIDNILAREERHHLADYKTCLRQIDRILRTRNPYTEPTRMSRELYFALYDEMATDRVEGWDYELYGSPRYFLYLLRRHVVTGACSVIPSMVVTLVQQAGRISANDIGFLRQHRASRVPRYSIGAPMESPLGVNSGLSRLTPTVRRREGFGIDHERSI